MSTAVIMTARKALELFWSIFPTTIKKKPCLPSWTEWQRARPDLALVTRWHGTYHPPSWAVVTGDISGIVILDFDGFKGLHLLTELGLEPHLMTGSGGAHVYFAHPGYAVKTLNGKSTPGLARLFPGLDIRGDGGYAVFCGRNTDGPYTWLREPDLYDFNLLPNALQQLIRK